jgi:hypothetical protein
MNDKQPETTVSTPSKPSLTDRVLRRDPNAEATPKPKTTLGHKAKNVAAVVGVVAVGAYVVSAVSKKKSVKVEATLPDVDVTTTDV